MGRVKHVERFPSYVTLMSMNHVQQIAEAEQLYPELGVSRAELLEGRASCQTGPVTVYNRLCGSHLGSQRFAREGSTERRRCRWLGAPLVGAAGLFAYGYRRAACSAPPPAEASAVAGGAGQRRRRPVEDAPVMDRQQFGICGDVVDATVKGLEIVLAPACPGGGP